MKMEQNHKADFLRTRFSFGLIVRADVETIEAIKRFVASQNLTPVYQVVDSSHLWIIRKPDAGGMDHERTY